MRSTPRTSRPRHPSRHRRPATDARSLTRTRRVAAARNIPIVEIACVKDYPGAWAEYRVYEDGYVQLTRRIEAPEAMAWTEKTRGMFAGLYRDYALGDLSDRCFVQRY